MSFHRWPPRITAWTEVSPGRWTFGLPQEPGYVETWVRYKLKREQSCHLCWCTMPAGAEVFAELKLNLAECPTCGASAGRGT